MKLKFKGCFISLLIGVFVIYLFYSFLESTRGSVNSIQENINSSNTLKGAKDVSAASIYGLTRGLSEGTMDWGLVKKRFRRYDWNPIGQNGIIVECFKHFSRIHPCQMNDYNRDKDTDSLTYLHTIKNGYYAIVKEDDSIHSFILVCDVDNNRLYKVRYARRFPYTKEGMFMSDSSYVQ
jgi:hypothetical protein